MCVVRKIFYVFSFPTGIYVGTLNLIASIPGSSILTLKLQCVLKRQCLLLKPLVAVNDKAKPRVCVCVCVRVCVWY